MAFDTQVDLGQPPAPTPAPLDPTTRVGPFNGVAAEIPGTIEAEEFDYGGEGVAYSDTDPGNNGRVRERPVDGLMHISAFEKTAVKSVGKLSSEDAPSK